MNEAKTLEGMCQSCMMPFKKDPLGTKRESETCCNYCFRDDRICYAHGAVLSNLPRKNQPKSSLKRLIGTPLYARMTVRNITTVRKLADLLQ